MASETKIQQPEVNEIKNDESIVAPQLKRRRLLKSTVAIPVIMTLSSGAALARTSNLVGAVDTVEQAAKVGLPGEEQIVCAIPDPVGQTEPPFDLGTSPQAIYGKAGDSLEVQAAFCQNEKGGILISMTAFTSLNERGPGFMQML